MKLQVSLALVAALACGPLSLATGAMAQGGDACNHAGGCPRGPIIPIKPGPRIDQIKAALSRINADPGAVARFKAALDGNNQGAAAQVLTQFGLPNAGPVVHVWSTNGHGAHANILDCPHGTKIVYVRTFYQDGNTYHVYQEVCR